MCAQCGLDDLAQFGLVGDYESYCREAAAAGSAPDLELADRIVSLALADAIVKLEQPGVPREIAGQRLAEVFTLCREAAEWADMPLAASHARRFLDREVGLAAHLIAEHGKKN